VESFRLWEKDTTMPRNKPPYDEAFKARIVELARAGRTQKSLEEEFGVTTTTIRNWLMQSDLDQGDAKGWSDDGREA